MKLELARTKRLAVPAAIAAVLVIAGVICIVAANRFLDEARRETTAANNERRAIQSKLSQATDEEREIREKLADYQSLMKRGVIGDEQRLDWVDTIALIKTERKLFDVKYSIQPQRPFELPGFVKGGDVEFLTSEMRVEMQLLHEDDLFNFLDDLRARMRSLVLVRSCAIQKADRGSAQGALVPRLRADCMIDLVTIRDSKKAKTS